MTLVQQPSDSGVSARLVVDGQEISCAYCEKLQQQR